MKNLMTAVVFEGEGDVRIENVPIPEVRRDDEVLLKVEIASICGSDVQIAKVPAGHPATKGVILGHEYVGIVEQMGDAVKDLSIGDRVAVEPNIYCGVCFYCKSGSTNLCENMIGTGCFANGGFAEYSVLPFRALHKVDKDTPAEIAVFAEPLSCALNSLEKLHVNIGDTVVVLGAGPVALLFIKALKASGVGKLIVSEKIQLRRDLAGRCGAIVIDPNAVDLAEFVKKETGVGADIVIDCVGSLLHEGIRCLRKAGKLLIFGMDSNSRSTVRPYDICHDEIAIIGGFITKNTFRRALNVLEQKIIEVEDLISHKMAMADFHQGLKVISEGKAIKVLIYPEHNIK
jgi:(R,R)-butanediol dehydrogenase/meso-butanediol dehydrogenase/diacetyl reductase